MAKRIGANRRLKRKNKKRKTPKKVSGLPGRLGSIIKLICFGTIIGTLGFLGAQRAAVYVNTVDFLKVTNFTVQGAEHVDTAEVLTLAAIQPGISMVDLKASLIRQRILKNPWIEKVSVKRRIPHTIAITVAERKPIAFVNLGSIYLTDRRGRLWPLKSYTYWNMPVFSGLADTLNGSPDHRLKKEDLARMKMFLRETQQAGDENSIGISQVDFSRGGIITIKLDSQALYAELKSDAVKEGMNYLLRILESREDNAEKIPHHINLCYNNVAFVR